MPNFGQELSGINFGAMIGGPLIAVIKAQELSARTTVEFIQRVGFDQDKARNVTFNYTKVVEGQDGQPKHLDCSLTVPLLTMLPIPNLRIEDVTIDFNAKLTSSDTTSSEATDTVSTEASGGANWGVAKVEFKASYSHQSKNNQTSKVDRTYSLGVRVHAVQDQMPAGLDRLLNILESCIHERTPAPGGSTAKAVEQASGK